MLLSKWDADKRSYHPSQQKDLRTHSHLPEKGVGCNACRASKSLHTCRRHGRHPAGNGAPGSDLAERRCTHFGAARQSLPVAVEALGMSALCLQTLHSALHACKPEPFNPALLVEVCLWTLSNGRSTSAELMPKHVAICTEQMKAYAMTQLYSECHDRKCACPDRKVACILVKVTKHAILYRHTWAIHWFQPKLLLLNVKAEHVLLVVLCMARGLPKIEVVNVGRDNFFILIVPVYLSDELQQIRSGVTQQWCCITVAMHGAADQQQRLQQSQNIA